VRCCRGWSKYDDQLSHAICANPPPGIVRRLDQKAQVGSAVALVLSVVCWSMHRLVVHSMVCFSSPISCCVSSRDGEAAMVSEHCLDSTTNHTAVSALAQETWCMARQRCQAC